LNAFVGLDIAMEGETWREIGRGVEVMAPKAIRDLMRAERFGNEGVQTLSGEALVDSVSAYDVFMQAMGFTPAKVAERYRENTWKRNRNDAIAARKSRLLDDATDAIRAGETIDPDTMQAINVFNKDAVESGMRDDVITSKTIMRSLRARLSASKRTEGGLLLPKSRNDSIRANAAPSIYN
jgi:urease gamma subunit